MSKFCPSGNLLLLPQFYKEIPSKYFENKPLFWHKNNNFLNFTITKAPLTIFITVKLDLGGVLYDLLCNPFPIDVPFTRWYIKKVKKFGQISSSCVLSIKIILGKFPQIYIFNKKTIKKIPNIFYFLHLVFEDAIVHLLTPLYNVLCCSTN